jgi:hypothetical protein
VFAKRLPKRTTNLARNQQNDELNQKTIRRHDVNPSQSMLRNRSRAGFSDLFDSVSAKPLSKTNSDSERRTHPNQDIKATITNMK